MFLRTLIPTVVAMTFLGFAGGALAQATAPQPVAVASDDHAAKVQRLVDGACGAAPPASAPAGDRGLYEQCRSIAKTRAEALVH